MADSEIVTFYASVVVGGWMCVAGGHDPVLPLNSAEAVVHVQHSALSWQSHLTMSLCCPCCRHMLYGWITYAVMLAPWRHYHWAS